MVQKVKKNSHVWARDPHEWYIEERWCVEALLRNEYIPGPVVDPCAGMGTIEKAFRGCMKPVRSYDLIDRRGVPQCDLGPFRFTPRPERAAMFVELAGTRDFFEATAKDYRSPASMVSNPPYNRLEEFIERALGMITHKLAVVAPLGFLASARRYTKFTRKWPLSRTYIITPRPSMPPGTVITGGEKPGGGSVDYCWLVFDKAKTNDWPAVTRWLNRWDMRQEFGR